MPFPQNIQDNRKIIIIIIIFKSTNFLNGGIDESNELKLITIKLDKISEIDDPLEIYSFAKKMVKLKLII